MSPSTNRFILLTAMLLACSKGAEPSGGHDEHDEHDEHGEKGEHHEEEGTHANEVSVSPEAAELAGIRVGKAERRALVGGAAIPAEVQFEPSSTAHVTPLASGRITKVTVTLGDRVRKNQLLGVIASSDVSTARARLEQSQARLAAAESTLVRQKQLSTEGIGAQRSLVEAEAQAADLRAEVEGLKRQLSVFGSGSAGDLMLTSPIDGVVVDLHATLGETATPDQPTFIVTDPSKVWVRGSVPELEIGRIQPGTAAIVRLHAYQELSMAGTIAYVAPALDERTRALPIRVSLTLPDARLKSGLFGTIELLGGAADERVVVVPADAVATVGGQQVVFVPADEANTFRPQPIALGRRSGGFFEVRSGLSEGSTLAMSGAFTLKSALLSGELSEGHSH